jgi:membrane protein
MKRGLLNFWRMLKTAAIRWNDRDPWRESAIIAYYAIFSLPGLLLVIITLAGYFFEESRISDYINQQIAEEMGEDTARQVQSVVNMAYDKDQSLFATIIGIATIFFGATGAFYQLQKSLNFIWDVKPDATTGIWNIIKARLLSFGLIITIAFLLLISLVVTTLIAALSKFLQEYLPDYIMYLSHILNFVISLAIIAFLFAIMFKYLPDAKIKWKTVWIGSVLTSLLFVLGKTGLGIYFGQANPESGYGAAGFIILILLWTSYSSMIVFFGAEFTRAYSDFKYRGKVEPAEHATIDKKAAIVKKLEEKEKREKEQAQGKEHRAQSEEQREKEQAQGTEHSTEHRAQGTGLREGT